MTYLISDTHWNHKNMIAFCGRPANFEEKLWSSLDVLHPCDTLIHLGDVCMGQDTAIHNRLSRLNFKKILIRGNHDKQSDAWYMKNGWSFVCDRLEMRYEGHKYALTHKPVQTDKINIYGHFHNNPSASCESELISILSDRHWQFCIEHEYKPVAMSRIHGLCTHNIKRVDSRIIFP
jgi:calcineurin-like phosphoesterase family protein